MVRRTGPGGSTEPSAIVEVAISRAVTVAVTDWRKHSGVRPGWRLRFTPAAGPGRDVLTDEPQARAWAHQVGNELRQLWDGERVEDVHLFVASSTEFAVLLGQQLRDRRRVHVYVGDNETGYRLAYTLGSGPR